MSAAPETPSESYEINGSCHCGAIKFKANNVDLGKVGRCNCTICTATGKLGTMLKPGDISVTNTPSGEPVVARYANTTDTSLFPPELTYYSPAYHRGECKKGEEWGRHFFCKTCSTNLFIVGNIPVNNIGEILSVNVLALDLKGLGKDLKEVVRPEKMRYVNGLDNTFTASQGEPHAHGLW
ncbi:hypothetical protein AOL_s00193g71 [Orbilia oligospora ATCC 24927]|uniref:CENP-V/GFA domain-containing protein n=2 Tax=Orbilia oligospora TaxID=2813651 RepID=G1XR72_ARTOA|nr:hypothetical protein AOL_s00193g71 [Orbilia oligospora ATCC 24927]EGX44343.1 hypothetical protein AOL_s00193g71 [Orbilia oligospora ATCC 24927]KAF3276605.1 hypothetical protein TWF970_006193 [Orbilia oligospora]